MRIATAGLRTGLAMTWFLQEVRWAGRCGHRPLRSVYRQDFVGGDAHIAPRPLQGARKNGRGRTPPLRKGCKRCGEVKNPPVTASPCQPPLGKGAKGAGDADCHSQFANWPRNDMVFARSRCKAGGRTGSFAPTGSFWLYLHRKIYISKAKEEDS